MAVVRRTTPVTYAGEARCTDGPGLVVRPPASKEGSRKFYTFWKNFMPLRWQVAGAERWPCSGSGPLYVDTQLCPRPGVHGSPMPRRAVDHRGRAAYSMRGFMLPTPRRKRQGGAPWVLGGKREVCSVWAVLMLRSLLKKRNWACRDRDEPLQLGAHFRPRRRRIR